MVRWTNLICKILTNMPARRRLRPWLRRRSLTVRLRVRRARREAAESGRASGKTFQESRSTKASKAKPGNGQMPSWHTNISPKNHIVFLSFCHRAGPSRKSGASSPRVYKMMYRIDPRRRVPEYPKPKVTFIPGTAQLGQSAPSSRCFLPNKMYNDAQTSRKTPGRTRRTPGYRQGRRRGHLAVPRRVIHLWRRARRNETRYLNRSTAFVLHRLEPRYL
jgi:hypothetical protein